MKKIIWKLWLQGWEYAPPTHKKCIKSWEYHNPDWEIIYLDSDNISCYIDIDDYKKFFEENENIMCKQHYSDIIRIKLLRKYGGVWVDANIWCQRPLSSWIFRAMNKEFFCFTGTTKERLIANWFIASEANGFIVSTIDIASKVFWHKRKEAPKYIWQHNLFKEIYQKNKKFKSIWDKTIKVSPRPPLILTTNWCKRYGIKFDVDKELKNPTSAIYKLERHSPETYKLLAKLFSSLGENIPEKNEGYLKYIFIKSFDSFFNNLELIRDNSSKDFFEKKIIEIDDYIKKF